METVSEQQWRTDTPPKGERGLMVIRNSFGASDCFSVWDGDLRGAWFGCRFKNSAAIAFEKPATYSIKDCITSWRWATLSDPGVTPEMLHKSQLSDQPADPCPTLSAGQVQGETVQTNPVACEGLHEAYERWGVGAILDAAYACGGMAGDAWTPALLAKVEAYLREKPNAAMLKRDREGAEPKRRKLTPFPWEMLLQAQDEFRRIEHDETVAEHALIGPDFDHRLGRWGALS